MGKILKLLRPELFFTFLLMVLSMVIIIVSLGYGLGALRRPGPGLYPFCVGVFLMLPFSIILHILGETSGRAKPLFINRYGLGKFLLMILTFILWVTAMPYLGYVIVTLVATCCFCKVMRLEGWLKPIALSVGTALFIYLLFDYWLYIDLPRGILG
jgi:hypothetical protein